MKRKTSWRVRNKSFQAHSLRKLRSYHESWWQLTTLKASVSTRRYNLIEVSSSVQQAISTMTLSICKSMTSARNSSNKFMRICSTVITIEKSMLLVSFILLGNTCRISRKLGTSQPNKVLLRTKMAQKLNQEKKLQSRAKKLSLSLVKRNESCKTFILIKQYYPLFEPCHIK